MLSLADFLQKRKRYTSQYIPADKPTSKTVLVSSYVWWTELIAYAVLRLGYNVVVGEPWYNFFLSDKSFVNFERVYDQWAKQLKEFKIQLIIGGNTTCIVPHVKTRQLLHNAAGVPLVNYWWDEPRSPAPMMKRGFTAADYLNAVRDPRTLNVLWDADVEQELHRFLSIDNTVHVPLGASPEFWTTDYVPLKDRQLDLCFLGNNHDEGGWIEKADPKVIQWAERVTDVKIANLDKSMADCVEQVGGPGEWRGSSHKRPYELAPTLKEEFERWNYLGGMLVRKLRNAAVRAAADHLGPRFYIAGTGWERMGLTAAKDHTGVPAAKRYYAAARASLNLFGGCVHGGMPLRPYEIASSNGLIFTQYNRELPSLFEPGKECVAFRNPSEMVEQLDRVLAHPDQYDRVVEAGKRRVQAEHTWEHRMGRVLDLAKRRFNLPW
jgi:spore maturation protein CgeB